MKGGMFAMALRGVSDIVKGYIVIVAIVLAVAGGAAAAHVASSIAVFTGTSLGIVSQEISPFFKSVTTGQGLVKGGTTTDDNAKSGTKKEGN